MRLGEQWGREAQDGWVIALTGDLGAGKTQLVKGLAAGLGSSARVQSPTFALINIYGDGRLDLNHIDLYRLDTPQQVHAAGLTEYLGKGVTVIEWADRLWPDELPPTELRVRHVRIEAASETERTITYEDFGN
jgi:tRNA threonylcarbamoyladenosine biosynthesis protein TsaE